MPRIWKQTETNETNCISVWQQTQKKELFQLVLEWHPTAVLLPGKSHGWRTLVGCSPWGHEESDTTEQPHFDFHFHALEKKMATHFSVLAWRIPGTGEPGGLPSLGSQRVGHDWSNLAAAAAAYSPYHNIFLGQKYWNGKRILKYLMSFVVLLLIVTNILLFWN